MSHLGARMGARLVFFLLVFGSAVLTGSLAVASVGGAAAWADLVPGNTAFAFDLYQKLQTGQENVFFSPYSVSLALAMTYAGARGETARGMEATLRFPLTQESLHGAFQQLAASLAGVAAPSAGEASGPVELSIANALWGEESVPFLESFVDLVSGAYGAGLRTVDFRGDPDGARATINRWVTEATREKIHDLLQPGSVTQATRLVVTNAVYFLGNWAQPFDPEATSIEPFRLLDGSFVGVPTMHQAHALGYARSEGLELVELSYAGARLSLVVVLPEAGRFRDVEAGLTGARFAELLARLEGREVVLSLPKFRVESEYSLAGALGALGMADAFGPHADFSGMNGARDLFLSDVIHKAFVEVAEQGTEAAAATAVVVLSAAVPSPIPPVEVRVDRPFLFAIRDRETGTLLFLGRVIDPTLDSEAAAPRD